MLSHAADTGYLAVVAGLHGFVYFLRDCVIFRVQQKLDRHLEVKKNSTPEERQRVEIKVDRFKGKRSQVQSIPTQSWHFGATHKLRH